MYIMKYLTGRQTPETKQSVKLGKPLRDPDAFARDVVERLSGELAEQSPLKATLGAVSKKVMSDAARFVSAQSKPASAITNFNGKVAERLEDFTKLISGVMRDVVRAIPAQADEPGVLWMEVRLIDMTTDAKGLVDGIVRKLVPQHFDGGRLDFGACLAKAVVERLCRASKLTEAQAREKPHRLKWPRDMEMAGSDLVETYLGGTPIGALLLSGMKIKIPDRIRFEHTLILGGSGVGKSRLLEHIICQDLNRPRGEDVGMVVIDSQRDLVNRISKLKAFAGNDRLLYVDASDLDYPVATNLFALSKKSGEVQSEREKEQAMAANIQLLEYLVSGLMGASMTTKQGTTFKFICELLASIDGATLDTLRRLLEEPKDFTDEMDLLPEISRHFFRKEFLGKGYGTTRKELLSRLYAVLSNKAFARMMGAKENRLDIGKAIDNGRVVLVNTSKDCLGDESKTLGRFVLALCVKAAFDRARLAPEKRRPAFVVVDEAGEIMDESIGQLLIQARKYKVGITTAMQSLSQMGDDLRALVTANTSLKLAAGVSSRDARAMAVEMRTSEEFILSRMKSADSTEFATFARNVIPSAGSWRIPFNTLDAQGTMSEQDFALLLARNRIELCGG